MITRNAQGKRATGQRGESEQVDGVQAERLSAEVDRMQRELLDIDRQISELTPLLDERNAAYQAARAEYEVSRLRLRLLTQRRSGLQSVLKSLTVF